MSHDQDNWIGPKLPTLTKFHELFSVNKTDNLPLINFYSLWLAAKSKIFWLVA